MAIEHHISQNWRLEGERYRMDAVKHPCGHVSFPPREVCPICSTKPIESLTPEPAIDLQLELAHWNLALSVLNKAN